MQQQNPILLRYGMLAMHLLIFYTALLVSARDGFAFHANTLQQHPQLNGYYHNHQRRTTAQPLIVDTFECSYDIALPSHIRRTNVRRKYEFKIKEPKFRHSHLKIIGTSDTSKKNIPTTNYVDKDLERGNELLQHSILHDIKAAKQHQKKQRQHSSIEGGDLVLDPWTTTSLQGLQKSTRRSTCPLAGTSKR